MCSSRRQILDFLANHEHATAEQLRLAIVSPMWPDDFQQLLNNLERNEQIRFDRENQRYYLSYLQLQQYGKQVDREINREIKREEKADQAKEIQGHIAYLQLVAAQLEIIGKNLQAVQTSLETLTGKGNA